MLSSKKNRYKKKNGKSTAASAAGASLGVFGVPQVIPRYLKRFGCEVNKNMDLASDSVLFLANGKPNGVDEPVRNGTASGDRKSVV